MSPDVLSHKFTTFVTSSRLRRVRLHDLRHTHASLLLMNGVNVKVVQERLGHSSVTITLDVYSHIMPSLQEQAAERLELALSATH